MPDRLEKISISGFKTIKSLEFSPASLQVLIGANGVGKSNFISFFRMLSYMLNGQLQNYVGRQGGAAALLHGGPSVTRTMHAHLVLGTDTGINEYEFGLAFASGDAFIFTEERFRYSATDRDTQAPWQEFDVGHRESRLMECAESGDRTARFIRGLLLRCVVHQFHNTSETARMHTKWDENDGLWLKEDGGNLAPVLLRLRDQEPRYYQRILQHIRQVVPFFAEFVLENEHGRVLLRWRERQSDILFSSSQASDGMLRIFALITLLARPPREFPCIMLLDEPELGLHPAAIQLIAGLILSASRHSQLILATQSAALVDQFEPEQVTVVERHENASTFRRLVQEDLADWLAEYSLAELWDKNVIGGRPAW